MFCELSERHEVIVNQRERIKTTTKKPQTLKVKVKGDKAI